MKICNRLYIKLFVRKFWPKLFHKIDSRVNFDGMCLDPDLPPPMLDLTP
jgi:hypothetical protein